MEKETQARVAFKMNEVLTAVENAARANWNTAFQSNSQVYSHYWEAFEQMRQMLIKEIEIATPYDDMAEMERRKKRNKAVSEIMERFCKRGEHDYRQKERLLVSIIDEAQVW